MMQTESQLNQLIDTNISDNLTGSISELKVRTTLKAIIARMFQIPSLVVNQNSRGLVVDNNSVLSFTSYPVVLQKTNGYVLGFEELQDAIEPAVAGDTIFVNKDIVLTDGSGSIYLKDGVNIDFRYHNINITGMISAFVSDSSTINCSIYNVNKIIHSWSGDYNLYGHIGDLSVLTVSTENSFIKLSCNAIVTIQAGVVCITGYLSVVELEADMITISSFNGKPQASFYVTSAVQTYNIDINLNRKSRLNLKANIINCSSEVLFMADDTALIKVAVVYINLKGKSLLAINKGSLLIFVNTEVTGEGYCLIKDERNSLSKTGLIRFEGANILRALCINTDVLYLNFPVIAVLEINTVIENYGSLRISQSLNIVGRKSIDILPVLLIGSELYPQTIIFNAGVIGINGSISIQTKGAISNIFYHSDFGLR